MCFSQLLFRIVIGNMFYICGRVNFEVHFYSGPEAAPPSLSYLLMLVFLFAQVGEVMPVDWTWLTKRVGYYSSALGIVGRVEEGLLQQKLFKLPAKGQVNGSLVISRHSGTASK